MPVLSDEDRRFLAELFRQHQWMMYRTVFPMLQNPWDTEDVIQSVAVKLTDKLPLLRSLEGPRLTADLAAACRNTALNHRRETQRRAEYPYSEELGCPGQSLAAQNLLPEMEDRFLALRQAWKGLDQRSQYLLRARYLERKSFAEIAACLGMQPKSARMALTRARRKARDLVMAALARLEAE